MKKISLILSAVVMTAMMLSSCGGGASKEVTIGKQVWMTQNLNVDKFRNGEIIPQAKTMEEWLNASLQKQPAWCYYENDPENGEKYGKMYNWYAVNDARGLAPEGWRIPIYKDFTRLKNFLGGNDAKPGEKMKSTSGWIDENGTNESGFSALPGGFRVGLKPWMDGCVGEKPAAFINKGYISYLWCANEANDNMGFTHVITEWFKMYRDIHSKAGGCYVRCIKD